MTYLQWCSAACVFREKCDNSSTCEDFDVLIDCVAELSLSDNIKAVRKIYICMYYHAP